LNDATRKAAIFIIGAPKCATSAIARALSLHPRIAFCSVKEPRFFSHDGCFAQGLDWYHGLFGDAVGLRAEASTSYGEAWLDHHRISAERIHAYNPSARFIYCVRHPLQRAVSEWREVSHQLRIGNPSIERIYGVRVQTGVDAALQSVPGFLDTSNYWKTIAAYRRYFDDSRIHVVFQENWAHSPDRELTDALRFIGIDDRFTPPSIDAVVNDKWLKARPRALLSLARSLPGYRTLARWAPPGARALMRPFLKHHPDGESAVTTKTRIIAHQRIGADIARFLEWRGLSPSHWEC
jgi:hypothetical protein